MTDFDPPRLAWLVLDGYGGRWKQPVDVLSIKSQTMAIIRARQRTKLAGRDRWLPPGACAAVPLYALQFESA